jgi:hypothetical protein
MRLVWDLLGATSLGVVLVFALAPTPALAQDVSACGPLEGGYGPFDYRTATPRQKHAVESIHFTSEVEALRGGKTTARVGADISYTLHAFPNHPRALLAMMRLSEREKKLKPRGAAYSIDCYFERAIRFRPDDPSVRTIFGTFLLKHGKPEAAVKQLEVAEQHAGSNGNVSYNLGLAYFDLKDYEKAREYAKRAREQGFALDGLENKLKRAGQWRG